jgi:hypothetical protein
VRPEVAVYPPAVPFSADLIRDVEYDRDRQDVVFLCQREQRLPRGGIHVRGIDYRQVAPAQANAGHVVNQRERIGRRLLAVLIVGDEPAAEVRRDHLRGPEMMRSERRLARSRGTDEHDERQGRDSQFAVRRIRINVTHG